MSRPGSHDLSTGTANMIHWCVCSRHPACHSSFPSVSLRENVYCVFMTPILVIQCQNVLLVQSGQVPHPVFIHCQENIILLPFQTCWKPLGDDPVFSLYDNSWCFLKNYSFF